MEINYKQLIFAREYRGLTQTALSNTIRGLSQSNLSKYEKGVGILSDEIKSKIIETLDFPEEFFKTRIINSVDNAHYRKRISISKLEKQVIDRKNRIIGYILDQMADSIDFPAFNFIPKDIEDGYSPEIIADFVRRQFRLGDEPIINIYSILEANGIIVYEYNYHNDDFDGVSFITDSGYYLIIMNSNASNDRKRFTLAHELGHLLMHLSPDCIISEGRDIEKEANMFASELLMPKSAIQNSLFNLKLSYLAPLKNTWGTSMSSIIRRAYDLHCIDKNKYSYFNVELSRKGYRKKEPIDVRIDSPILYHEAYKMHLNQLNFTMDELARGFKLPLDIIFDIFTPKSNILRLKPKINHSPVSF